MQPQASYRHNLRNDRESIVTVTLRPSTVGWPNGRFQLILKQVINHDLGERTNKYLHSCYCCLYL